MITPKGYGQSKCFYQQRQNDTAKQPYIPVTEWMAFEKGQEVFPGTQTAPGA